MTLEDSNRVARFQHKGNMSATPKYKLTYFDGTGRAEPIRLVLAAAGVKYEDCRIKREDWPKLKPTMPQESMPIFEIDGKTTIVQSHAIQRYVAREYGMYGKNNLESTRIDEIQDTINDLIDIFRTAFRNPDEDKKKELMKKLREEDGPKYLGYLDKLITSSGKNGFAVSDSLSLADCCVHVIVDFLQLTDKLKAYPKVATSIKRVEENANIAKWLKARPVFKLF